MKNLILRLFLAITLFSISCKKEEKKEPPVNYKVKSNGSYTFSYTPDGLLAQTIRSDSFITKYEWTTESLTVSEFYKLVPSNITRYERNPSGYVLSSQWAYNSQNELISSNIYGTETIYTWIDGNCIRKEYPGLADGFEYSNELNTMDFGLKFFPTELEGLTDIPPSKNLCVKATLTYDWRTFEYVKDSKGRIIEKADFVVGNKGTVNKYKKIYSYFD